MKKVQLKSPDKCSPTSSHRLGSTYAGSQGTWWKHGYWVHRVQLSIRNARAGCFPRWPLPMIPTFGPWLSPKEVGKPFSVLLCQGKQRSPAPATVSLDHTWSYTSGKGPMPHVQIAHPNSTPCIQPNSHPCSPMGLPERQKLIGAAWYAQDLWGLGLDPREHGVPIPKHTTHAEAN